MNLCAVRMEFNNMVKKIILCVILIILTFSLVSCQTVQGLGGDIKWIGQETADLLGGDRIEDEGY